MSTFWKAFKKKKAAQKNSQQHSIKSYGQSQMQGLDVGSVVVRWGNIVPKTNSKWIVKSVILIQRDILVFGSDSQNSPDTKLYIYDTRSGKWSGADLHGLGPDIANYYKGCVSTANDKIFLLWGQQHLEVSVLDFLANMKWDSPECTGEYPIVTEGYSATHVNDVIYVFGGESLTGDQMGDLYKLDTQHYVWEKVKAKKEIPTPRIGHSATVLPDNTIFYFGGKSGLEFCNDGYVYDPKTSEFTKIAMGGAVPDPRAFHTMLVHRYKKDGTNLLICFGGYAGSKIYNDISVMDLKTMMWFRVQMYGDGPSPRYNAFGGSLKNGIIVFGGQDNKDSFFDVSPFNIENVSRKASKHVERNNENQLEKQLRETGDTLSQISQGQAGPISDVESQPRTPNNMMKTPGESFKNYKKQQASTTTPQTPVSMIAQQHQPMIHTPKAQLDPFDEPELENPSMISQPSREQRAPQIQASQHRQHQQPQQHQPQQQQPHQQQPQQYHEPSPQHPAPEEKIDLMSMLKGMDEPQHHVDQSPRDITISPRHPLSVNTNRRDSVQHEPSNVSVLSDLSPPNSGRDAHDDPYYQRMMEDGQYGNQYDSPTSNRTPLKRDPTMGSLTPNYMFKNKHIINLLNEEGYSPRSPERADVSPSTPQKPTNSLVRTSTPVTVIDDDEEQAQVLNVTFQDLSKVVASKKNESEMAQAKDRAAKEGSQQVKTGATVSAHVELGEHVFSQNNTQVGSPQKQTASDRASFQQLEEQLLIVYNEISTVRAMNDGNYHVMNRETLYKLIKVTRLFSNELTLPMLHNMVDELIGNKNHLFLFDIFKSIIVNIAKIRLEAQHAASDDFEATTTQHLRMYKSIIVEYLLPYYHLLESKRVKTDPYLSSIISMETITMIQKYDHVMRHLYILFSSLGLSSAHTPSWSVVKAKSIRIALSETLEFAETFELVPYLIPRHLFSRLVMASNASYYETTNSSNNATLNTLNYSEFCESLVRVALYVYSRYPYSTKFRTIMDRVGALFTSVLFFNDPRKWKQFSKHPSVSVRNKLAASAKTLMRSGGEEKDNELKDIRAEKRKESFNEILSDSSALRDDLAHIFMYYCAFGDHLNITQMSSAKFARFVRESKLPVTKEKAELIYIKLMNNRSYRLGDISDEQKQTHARMTFPYFMEALKVLALRVYPKSDPKEALYSVLKNLILPNARREKKRFTNVNIMDEAVQILLTKYKKEFMGLFHAYCSRTKLSRTENFGCLSIEALIKMATHFDITPTLITKKDIYRVFRSTLLNTTIPDIDFVQFEECVCKMAYIAYSKYPYSLRFQSLAEKVRGLIQKIGLDNYVQLRKKLEKLGHKIPYGNRTAKALLEQSNQIQIHTDNDLPSEEELDVKLRAVFAFYSEFGNKYGNQRLGSQQFTRFCKDVHIIDSTFSNVDADLIYIEITKNDRQAMTYETFCDCLTMLAERRFMNQYLGDTTASLRHLLVKHVLPYGQRKPLVQPLEITTEEYSDALVILSEFQVPLNKIFSVYSKLEILRAGSTADMNSLDSRMSAAELIRFCQDFDICPMLLSVSECNTAFQKSSFNNQGLTFEKFVDCLARMAIMAYSKTHFQAMYKNAKDKGRALMDRMDMTSASRLATRLRKINVHSMTVSQKHY